ncbi:MAG: hypothetical protein KC591_05080, partial [Gemmatimonadetes bacterium]|nr:hypothetical protein [Gemmatimonadota bacterium]
MDDATTKPDDATDAEVHIEDLYLTDARICSGCLHGVGDMCNTPGCVFIRQKPPTCEFGTLLRVIESNGYRVSRDGSGG